MHKSLPAQKSVLTNERLGRAKAAPDSVWEFIRKLPARMYNAAFTPMGRKNLFYFVKRQGLRLNLEYRRQGAIVYPLNNGHKFVLHRGNNLSELVFLEGAYEPLETLIVSRLVQRGDIVFDCGANVGYFTAILNRLVQPHGQVHAFEPGAGTFAKLEQTRTLLRLERAYLHPQAVSNAVGEIDFWSSTSGSDAQQKTVKGADLSRHLRHDKVPATTLDTFMTGFPAEDVPRIAFVKCDIEGAETAMLTGATRLLAAEHPPVWLIEHNRYALSDHNLGSADLLAFFPDSDIYFVPICWPPSVMASPRAERWTGQPSDLPDECNLLIFPRRGRHAARAATLRHAGLLA